MMIKARGHDFDTTDASNIESHFCPIPQKNKIHQDAETRLKFENYSLIKITYLGKVHRCVAYQMSTGWKDFYGMTSAADHSILS